MSRHRAHVLPEARLSQRAIVEETGVLESSVPPVTREPAVDTASTAALTSAGAVGRRSVIEAFWGSSLHPPSGEPGLKTVGVLSRMRMAGWLREKSALYEMVRELRPRYVASLVRFEKLPGEFSQHDSGEVQVQ